MGYALPTNTDYVSSSWDDHRRRNPPSSEPGTDYGCAYGSPLYAPDNGRVVDLKHTNSNATGRYVTIDMDDGRRTRSLHLSEIWVSVGDRVARGQQIGKTGASAYGSDWGVGAHVHQTLWAGWYYAFGKDATIDFARYVGGGSGPVTGNQRQVGPNGANGRRDPSTSGGVTQTLAPHTVGDFNGWINGQGIEGNSVWFRGQHSGDFFWSGGFTDKGTHDLTDLNPPPATHTRTVGDSGANGRKDPSTKNPVTQTLAPGTVADFDGWTNGERIEGNNVWFRGMHSGDWFWSGGFTSTATAGLEFIDLTPPPATKDRTVGTASANIRAYPYTTSAAIGSEAPGTVVPMNAYARAEGVEGNGIWFRRSVDNNWMWSGGFTSQKVDDLPEVAAPQPPAPVDKDNPRGLPEYSPVYERAFKGLEAPLGYRDDGSPSLRDTSGTSKVDPIIDRFIVHHTATTMDQLDWFSYKNNRSVCPTFYLRTDGKVFELIRPQWKPAATGVQWNWRSIAVETLNSTGSPTWEVTDVQLEEISQMIAWLAEYDGKELNGVPVDFKIDRTHVISHQEALPGTECPGPYVQPRMDAIVARAQAIYNENHPTPPDENFVVPKALGDQIRDLVNKAFPEEE